MGSTLAIVDGAQEPKWKEKGRTTFSYLITRVWPVQKHAAAVVGPHAIHPRASWYVGRMADRQVAQKSQGIQTLLEAEKEATKIVEQARSCTCTLTHARPHTEAEGGTNRG